MSMKPIKLENKLTVNGKEVTSVTLDFSKLTGRDLIKAEAEVRADGESHLTQGDWIYRENIFLPIEFRIVEHLFTYVGRCLFIL